MTSQDRGSRATPGGGLKLAAAALSAALALSGCAGLLAGGEPPRTFDLTVPADLHKAGGLGGNIVVVEPVAVAVLDGVRIVVKPTPVEVTYLPLAQWSDRLPKLVQAKMIEALENSSRLKSVGRPGDRLSVDYQLVSEIRAFEIDAASGSAMVEITVKMINDKTGKIAAARVFSARRPVGQTIDGASAARALDAALGDVLESLVGWGGRSV